MAMSAPRTMVEFRTDIPDDTIEDDEDIVQFGGQSVALALSAMLTEQGLAVDLPEYEFEHGWTFTASRPDLRLWVQVTLIEDVLVMTKDVTFRWKFWEKPTGLGEVLGRLNEQMRSDGRFHDLTWYFPAEYQMSCPGSPRPVAPLPPRR